MEWTEVLKDVLENHRQYSNTDLHHKLTLMHSLVPDEMKDIDSLKLNDIIRARFPQLVKIYSIKHEK